MVHYSDNFADRKLIIGTHNAIPDVNVHEKLEYLYHHCNYKNKKIFTVLEIIIFSILIPIILSNLHQFLRKI